MPTWPPARWSRQAPTGWPRWLPRLVATPSTRAANWIARRCAGACSPTLRHAACWKRSSTRACESGCENAPYCLLAVPLLAENITQYRWVDRVLLVDVPESVQLDRLITRDGTDKALALRMIGQQASRAERLALADDVIENSGDEGSQDRAVGRRQDRRIDPVWRRPLQRLSLQRPWQSAPLLDAPGVEHQLTIVVAPRHADQRLGVQQLDAEF